MELSFPNKEKKKLHGSTVFPLTPVLLLTCATTLRLFLRLQLGSCTFILILHQTSMILKELWRDVVFHLLIDVTGLFGFSQSKEERETDIFHY